MLRKSQGGPSPEEFWAEVERERGERVIKYSLGQYLGGWEDMMAPRWGLVYVTDSAICFRTFPQRNWFSALMGAGGGASEKSQEMELCLPRADIHGVELRKTTSLLKKIFAPDPPTIEISCRDEYHREVLVRFQIDPAAKEFLTILSQTL
jgi:hypothetical protein